MAGSIWSYCSCKGPDGKRYKPGDCPEWGQRAHRKWAFVIDQDRTPEGRRQQLKRMSFPSRQAAERAMEAELPAIRAHIAPTVSGRQTTVSEYLDRWLRTARNSKGKPWRPSTKATYESAARLYLRPLLGRYRLADLRREHVEAMAEAMRDGTFRPPEARPRAVELSDRTVYAAFSVLRAPLFAAMDDHLISANPCQRARVPGPETTEAEVFEVEQARIFLDYVQEAEPQLAPAYRLALQYTLRRGELAGLQWSDIDLDAGTLRVVRAVSEAGRPTSMSRRRRRAGASSTSASGWSRSCASTAGHSWSGGSRPAPSGRRAATGSSATSGGGCSARSSSRTTSRPECGSCPSCPSCTSTRRVTPRSATCWQTG